MLLLRDKVHFILLAPAPPPPPPPAHQPQPGKPDKNNNDKDNDMKKIAYNSDMPVELDAEIEKILGLIRNTIGFGRYDVNAVKGALILALYDVLIFDLAFKPGVRKKILRNMARNLNNMLNHAEDFSAKHFEE